MYQSYRYQEIISCMYQSYRYVSKLSLCELKNMYTENLYLFCFQINSLDMLNNWKSSQRMKRIKKKRRLNEWIVQWRLQIKFNFSSLGVFHILCNTLKVPPCVLCNTLKVPPCNTFIYYVILILCNTLKSCNRWEYSSCNLEIVGEQEQDEEEKKGQRQDWIDAGQEQRHGHTTWGTPWSGTARPSGLSTPGS